MPTPAKLLALFQDSMFLTNAYVSIHLVRIDERSGNLIVLAGETIEVEIYPNGRRIIR
jgi:hypothetical protein